MADFRHAYTISEDGLSFDDEVFIIGGFGLPWNRISVELYPPGTRYFADNGEVYIKGPAGTSPETKDFTLYNPCCDEDDDDEEDDDDDESGRKEINKCKVKTVKTDGQFLPSYRDKARKKKVSIETGNYTWAVDRIRSNDWIQISGSNNSKTGHVMPFDGVIVGFTSQCTDMHGCSKPINLHVGSADQGLLVNIIQDDQTDICNDLDIDFKKGDNLRLFGGMNNSTNEQINDVVITLRVKWVCDSHETFKLKCMSPTNVDLEDIGLVMMPNQIFDYEPSTYLNVGIMDGRFLYLMDDYITPMDFESSKTKHGRNKPAQAIGNIC